MQLSIRTFLGWTLAVEVEGCWPWQKKQEASSGAAEGVGATLFQAITAPSGVTGDEEERRK